jgi:hypothetical protein
MSTGWGERARESESRCGTLRSPCLARPLWAVRESLLARGGVLQGRPVGADGIIVGEDIHARDDGAWRWVGRPYGGNGCHVCLTE